MENATKNTDYYFSFGGRTFTAHEDFMIQLGLTIYSNSMEAHFPQSSYENRQVLIKRALTGVIREGLEGEKAIIEAAVRYHEALRENEVLSKGEALTKRFYDEIAALKANISELKARLPEPVKEEAEY